MAKSNYSNIDEYGFERPENFNYELYDKFMSDYLRILTRRSQRWNKLYPHNNYKRSNTLKRFIRKGIPNDRRLIAWMSISGAVYLQNESTQTYNQIVHQINNQPIVECIQIDVPRTFPDNIFFSSTHSLLPSQLYNTLAAFAYQNKSIGYCQGLNYIAGLLLLCIKNEEASFWLLKVLVENILPDYYVVNMAGLIVDLAVLNELVETSEPEISRHVRNVGMPWAMGTTKWFVCLYSEVLPTETVFRIWDCLFYEGSKILFRVAITLIKMHKQDILNASELSELITCFKNMKCHEQVIDCHQFMNNVFRMSGNITNKKIAALRKKYKDETKSS